MAADRRLAEAAKALADSVLVDDIGTQIGGKYVGGNGGLLSRETIARADAVRRALAAAREKTDGVE